MSTKQQNNEEEVDLGSLFQIIGRAFSRFINFIVTIFIGLFDVLIISLLFFRKHAIKIIIAGVVLGTVGYFLDSNKEIIYESKMLVKPNFNSTSQLYSNIKFYNDLVGQEEYELLINTFNINEDEAKSLRGFSIKPIKNENDIVSGYDELLASVDTISLRNYKIAEFKEAFTNNNYKVHEIKVRSTKNKIFTKFDGAILSSIINNDYFKKLKESENVNLNRSYDLYQKNLKDADTLRKVYMKALLDEAKKPTQGTSIDMGSRGNGDNEIQLFSISRNLNSNLSKINEDKAHKTEIVNVISSFQKIGSKEKGLLKNKMLVLGAIGVLGTVLILLLKELNGFLNNYKK